MFLSSADTAHPLSTPELEHQPLSRNTLLFCFIAGAVSVFAFAPFGWWPLQIATLALLIHFFIRAPRPRDAFLIGWVFSSALLMAGTYWLVISLHTYGGLPAWLAIIAIMLLSCSLGLLYGFALWVGSRIALKLKHAGLAALAIAPACWMLADWTRNWIFTGFSWLATGYAHTTSPLSGYAAMVGVYGIGWICTIIAGCIAWMFQTSYFNRVAVALIIVLISAGSALKSIHWTEAHGSLIRVRLLQGNVPQQMKFNEEHIVQSLALYRDMITEAPADLIATPETAVPLLSTQLPENYLETLAHYARQNNSTLLVGIPWSPSPGIYLNSLIGYSSAQATPYRYDKHHLVPFGEFIPRGARWFVDMMHIPLGDFGRGDLYQAPIDVRDQWVLPNICYEDLFGEEIAAQIAAAIDRGSPEPTLLLNVSNIAWFGDSIALPQHLQISQMRTLETGRPMLRATNTGATAVINSQGRVLSQLPPWTRATLVADVQGMKGMTPYIRLGNLPVVGLASLLLLGLWFISRQARKSG